MRIISGAFKNLPLNSPKGLAVRPTLEKLRACLFNICQNEIEEADFLDLFAGSGAMGLEALSRGASFSTFVEQDRLAASCVRENIAKLNIKKQTELIQGNAFIILDKWIQTDKKFDIIFADPPYQSRFVDHQKQSFLYNHKILSLVDEGHLLRPSGQLFLEDAFSEQTDHLLIDKQLKRLYLKSVRNFGNSLLRQYLFL
jgi:16S rRNA (guanine966-N2)-methyltransferase